MSITRSGFLMIRLAAIFALSSTGQAQVAEPHQPTAQPIGRTDDGSSGAFARLGSVPTTVKLHIAVLDGAGRPIPDIQRAYFRVLQGGVIDAIVVAERAAKRECSISYILSLDA